MTNSQIHTQHKILLSQCDLFECVIATHQYVKGKGGAALPVLLAGCRAAGLYMDVDQLKTFVTLAKTRNISRTATLLFLSQPAVTNRLHALERELGYVLAEHAGKEMHLTDKGEIFLPYATQVLSTMEEVMSVLRANGKPRDDLRVAASPLPSTYILPRIVQAHKLQYPDLCIDVHTNHQREVFSLVLDNEVDVALVGVKFRHPSIETLTLCEDTVCLVAGCHHELARKLVVRPSDLRNTSVLWFDRDAVASYWRDMEDTLLKSGLDDKGAHVIRVDSCEAAKSVIGSGCGVAFLPAMAIAQEVQNGSLVMLNAPWLPVIPYHVFVVYKKVKQNASPIKEFLELSQAVVSLPAILPRDRV